MKNSKSKNSNTGYKGIRYRKSTGKFEVYISYYRKRNYGNTISHNKEYKQYISTHKSLEEAVTARENFITSLY